MYLKICQRILTDLRLIFAVIAAFTFAGAGWAADLPAPADQPVLRPPIVTPGSRSTQGSAATNGRTVESLIDRPQIKPFVRGQATMLRPYEDPHMPAQPITLYGAVAFADKNYPRIMQAQAEVRAAQRGVSLQKVKEYNPYSMMSYEQVVATHNKLTQLLFADPTLPTNPGPGFNTVNMSPNFFSGTGFIFDWAPLDFGLHKARIQEAKANWTLAQSRYAVTQLDVVVNAASAFLLVVVTDEQVQAAEANVHRFEEFSRVVHASVDADLRPGADASLADAQLANSKNDLIRAKLQYELAVAELANALGIGGRDITVDPGKIALVSEPEDSQLTPPAFETHPLALQARALILTEAQRKRVLDKEYYPIFRFLGGMNFRGSGLSVRGQNQSADAHGFAPAVPNWNVGIVANFNFMDILRIQSEKKVVQERINAQRHGYNLVLQNLRTQDVQSRARVKAAVELAANMPVQVQAALLASKQAEARYEAGLGSVAQVAEANQVLADSRVKEAVAKIGVWQSLLAVAAVHGDLKPFLEEAIRFETETK